MVPNSAVGRVGVAAELRASRRPHSLSLVNRSINLPLQPKPRRHTAVAPRRPRVPNSAAGRGRRRSHQKPVGGPALIQADKIHRNCAFGWLLNHVGRESQPAAGRGRRGLISSGGPTSLSLRAPDDAAWPRVSTANSHGDQPISVMIATIALGGSSVCPAVTVSRTASMAATKKVWIG